MQKMENQNIQNIQSLKRNDIVKHFKYETLNEDQKKDCLYMYKILDTNVIHTETGEKLVVYSTMYDGKKYGMNVEKGQTFARPADMFFSKVDKENYPNIKQVFRFEKI